MGRESFIACAVLLVLSATPRRAAAADQRLVAALSVNGMERPPAPIALRGKDVLVRVADLEAAGLRGFAGKREQGRDRAAYVSLQSLAPLLRFTFDEQAIALRVTADPRLLPASTIDLAPERPQMRLSRETSTFLNYSLSLDDGARLSTYGEAGVSVGGALAYSGFSRDADGIVRRGASSITFDQPEAMRRSVAGDVYATSGPLGASLLLGGVSIAREFSLDPYHPHTPLPRATGAALTPSQVDIYVDGQLVRQQKIAPGAFELDNVPATAGLGTVRMVVRDAFGRTQEIQSSSYVSSGLLSPGLSDYQLAAGFARPDLTQSFGYREPVVMARIRRGLFDNFTAGVRAEVSERLVSGGALATLLTPAGEVELSGAASGDGGSKGAAASLSWGFSTRRGGLGARVLWTAPQYANASVRAADDRPLLQANATAGVAAFQALSLGLSAETKWMRDTGRTDTAELRATLSIGAGASLLLSGGVSREQGLRPMPEGSVFLTWAFGERNVASATWARQNGTTGAAVDLQRSLPLASGVGYRVHAEQGAQASGDALLQLQGEHGLLEAHYARLATGTAGSVTASGGLAFVDGAFFETRPLSDSFALVQVPGVQGVPATLNNQDIGKTDSSGNLIVPALLPYVANRLGIRARSLSMAYKVGATEQSVAAPYRGAALARFEVRRMHAVTGVVELVRSAQERIAAHYGELTVQAEGHELTSPLGSDGRFFFEQLAAGLYAARVLYGSETCAFTLRVPDAGTSPLQQLGTIRCDARPLMLASGAGKVFVDENGDGEWQAGEPALSGVQVAAGTKRVRTGADGSFELEASDVAIAKGELPAGFVADHRTARGDFAVRRPAPLKDLGAFLVVDLGDGPIRLQQVQAASIPMSRFLQGRPLTAVEDASVQRLGTDVLDASDLRVLAIAHAPARGADAFGQALTAARAAQRYLRGPALVPPALLLWTIAAADPSAPDGQVDILLVRMPRAEPPRARTKTPCAGRTACR